MFIRDRYYTVNSAVRTGFFCCIGSYLCEKGVLMYRISHNEGIFLSLIHICSTTGDTIDFYEENLKDAQVQYGIQNGQAYQDTAAALQNQIASSEVGIKSRCV